MRSLRKFKFSDLTLAHKVRGNMRNILIKFDYNQNRLFEESEIKPALIQILGQDEMEVDYAVKNVFRYDRDGDNKVTYTQFTNFSVQQHFGEMAIQRLHKKGYYQNGARRIMNLEEFKSTLNYCLSFIESQGTDAQYERLFNEIDLDQDKFISYQDYFIFLREYFGSQSQAFEHEESPIPPPNNPDPPKNKFIDGNGQTPQQRFAKLIYSQFKITVMERDRNKNLILERNQVEDILSNSFKLNYTEQTTLQDRILSGTTAIKYDDFMRKAVVGYLGEFCGRKYFQNQSLNEDQFVEFINKVCDFVAIRPAQHILRACFKDAVRSGSMSQGDYISMIRTIFENFKFDTRGLSGAKTGRSENISYQSSYAPTTSYQTSSYQPQNYQIYEPDFQMSYKPQTTYQPLGQGGYY